jgi:hypothetical protein
MIENNEREQMLADAFSHLQMAIELLDRADAPGNIAAHADLALHQLMEELGPPSAEIQRIRCN